MNFESNFAEHLLMISFVQFSTVQVRSGGNRRLQNTTFSLSLTVQGMGAEPINASLGIDIFTSGCQGMLSGVRVFVSDELRSESRHRSCGSAPTGKCSIPTWYITISRTSNRRVVQRWGITRYSFVGMRAAVQPLPRSRHHRHSKHNHALIDRLLSTLDQSILPITTNST